MSAKVSTLGELAGSAGKKKQRCGVGYTKFLKANATTKQTPIHALTRRSKRQLQSESAQIKSTVLQLLFRQPPMGMKKPVKHRLIIVFFKLMYSKACMSTSKYKPNLSSDSRKSLKLEFTRKETRNR